MSFEAHNLPKGDFTSVSSSQILKANIFRRAHNESTKSSVSIFFFTFFFVLTLFRTGVRSFASGLVTRG